LPRRSTGADDWRQFASALEKAQPPDQQQGALGVEAGRARFQAILQPLTRQTEQTSELRLVPVFPQVRPHLPHELVSERGVRTGPQSEAAFSWPRPDPGPVLSRLARCREGRGDQNLDQFQR